MIVSNGVDVETLLWSDILMMVKGVEVFYKPNVAITTADLSVRASHLDSLLCICLAEAGLRCRFVSEAAYGMGWPSTGCATLLREYLWALRADEKSLPAMCTNETSLTRII